jgi:NADH-quinone oxidoreductase subunit C
MTPEALGAHVTAAVPGSAAEVSFGQVTVDVDASEWHDAAALARDDPTIGCGFFDWLSAYDDRDAGLAVVLHVWSVRARHHLFLRTRVPRDGGRLATVTDVWRGAAWHERETYEMFGIVFDGHPNLVPLLLPDGFEGNPLRKEFVLASRVAKSWPGAKEPGESEHDVASPGRRRMLPPGVPAAGEWGPGSGATDAEAPATEAPAAEAPAAEAQP